MGIISDLLGTFSNTFKIGKAKATIDASGLTAARTLTLQDKAGTVALTSDIDPYRNRVHNPCMRVAQRAAPTLSSSWQYGACDRHMVRISSGSSISGTIAQTALSGTTSGYADGANTASWTTGNFRFQHRMEAANVYDLSSKVVTVKAKVYQNSGGARNFKIDIGKPTTTIDTFSAQTVLQSSSAISVSSAVVTEISVTFSALGSSDAALGLFVTIYDSDAANTVSSKHYLVSDLQVVLGSVAPDFEMRPFSYELSLCQRYFEKTYDLTVAPGTNTGRGLEFFYGAVDASGNGLMKCYFKVPKRVVPTLIGYTLTGISGQWSYVGDGVGATTGIVNIDSIGQNGFRAYVATGVAAWKGCVINGHWAATADL